MGNDSTAVTKYRILTLDDFTKVPEEHIDECLRAFKAEIAFARRLKTAAGNAIERELRDLEARERDEKMGGFEPAYLKRFLFYAPKSKAAAG